MLGIQRQAISPMRNTTINIKKKKKRLTLAAGKSLISQSSILMMLCQLIKNN
jgi:hypothetical protein